MAPVLRIPNDEDLFKLSTDASDFATRAVLSQKDMQTNLWHPIAFFSKSLNVYERNYKIYDKELLCKGTVLVSLRRPGRVRIS